jgi:hypothetical protein
MFYSNRVRDIKTFRLLTRMAATESRFVVHADEKQGAFVELEAAIRLRGELS